MSLRMKQGEQGAVGKPPVGGGKRSLPDAHECARRPEEPKKLNTENVIYSKIKWVNEPNAQVSKKGVKMFNLFGHQDKTNQIYIGIPPHSPQNQQQMLVRCLGKGALMNHLSRFEINVKEFPQQLQNLAPIGSKHSTSVCIPKRIKVNLE